MPEVRKATCHRGFVSSRGYGRESIFLPFPVLRSCHHSLDHNPFPHLQSQQEDTIFKFLHLSLSFPLFLPVTSASMITFPLTLSLLFPLSFLRVLVIISGLTWLIQEHIPLFTVLSLGISVKSFAMQGSVLADSGD